MARRLERMPGRVHLASRSRLYPWDVWLDGSVWELEHGIDYQTAPSVFRSTAVTEAARRGLRLETRVDGERVYLHALPREEHEDG